MNKLDLSVNIAGVKWKNPITTASGTFSIKDSSEFYDPSILGAMTSKGVSSIAWSGNPSPRIAETYGGMLNSVGLQNGGVDYFIKNELPLYKSYDSNVIINLAGHSIEEYVDVAAKLDKYDEIDMFELNISCPNVKAGGIGFGTDPKLAYEVTKAVKAVISKPLIVKLSPNVTDIKIIARAVEEAGADAISLINTLLGMKIDINKGKFVLANKTGGLSGPCVKPVAIRLVHEVRQVTNLPIIGLGGISTAEDVVEFLMAGANAVAVGSATLMNPLAIVEILEDLKSFMIEHNYTSIQDIKDAFKD